MNRALIANGYELFRLSLREVLRRSGRFGAIEEAGDMGALVRASAAGRPVDLVALDPVSLGFQASDGVDLVSRLYPSATVLLFLAEGGALPPAPAGLRLRLLRHSARLGEIEAALDELAGIRPQEQESGAAAPVAVNGARAAPAQVTPLASAVATRPPRLSRRQREILLMVSEGLANKQIAHRLGIAEGTVKAHIHAIFRALGVSNRTQAVVKFSALPAA